MDKEVLEVVLRRSMKDSIPKRIIDAKWESALPKGENYTSTILRLSLKVVLGNGRIAKKSFIAKKENTGEAAAQIKNDFNLFKMEASVYTNILREMEYLMEEFGDTEGPLWCQFIHYSQPDGIIVLEDLKASGFTTVKRTEAQDLEHARLVIRSLGRYHAMAKVLEGRGLISKDDYKIHPFLADEFYIRNFVFGARLALIKAMKAAWGEEWAETAEKLSQYSFEDFAKNMKKCGQLEANTFKCLNHGDCWNNNMLFKYSWDGRPIGVRFVDFQGPHYNTPCMDLIYFMYTSIKPNIRRQNYKSLIELYHDSLTSSLDKFGYKDSKPSLKDINNAIERLSFFALNFYVGIFPVLQTKTTDAMDLDKIFKTNGEEGFNVNIYSEEGMIEKMGEEIKRILELKEL